MKTDYERFKYILRYFLFKIIPPQFYQYIIGLKYRRTFHRIANLKFPTRLSEKIQWLKLYDNSIEKTLCSDKLAVKNYISKVLPNLKFAKVYQEASSFNELNFELLPDSFMLKTNHAWKTNIYVDDKKKLTKEILKNYKKYYNWVLKINYAYWSYYELQYKNIAPKVYAEELIGNFEEADKVFNYEIYCFNGIPEFILYRNCDIIYKQYIYDTEWNRLNFDISYGNSEKNSKPQKLKEMIYYSKILSKNIKFVRIDFMEFYDEIYFCEMTFTPFSGFIEFKPDIFDLYYGNKLKL